MIRPMNKCEEEITLTNYKEADELELMNHSNMSFLKGKILVVDDTWPADDTTFGLSETFIKNLVEIIYRRRERHGVKV